MHIYVYTHVSYYKVLAHEIMGSMKPQYLSARWSPRKVHYVVEKPKSWKTEDADTNSGLKVCVSEHRGQGISVPADTERAIAPFLCHLVPSMPSIDWVMSSHAEESCVLCSVHTFLSLLKIPSQTLPGKCLNKTSGHPNIQSNCHKKLPTTLKVKD
jgi:hypothetical protein